MKVAVVILNWNGKNFLESLLPNLIDCTPQDWAEIIIADNASTDASVEFMQKNYPQIRLIKNSSNFGFALGYNLALNQVEADYYVLLNSDVELSKNWLEPLISVLEKDSRVAAVQPKLLSYFDRNKFEYAGGAGGFLDYLGYPFCKGRIFDSLEEDKGQYQKESEIFWATGAALCIRASLYKKLGGLDADFFAHMEEIDLCWRLKNLGYKIMYCPSSIVYHIGGGTLPKSSERKTYLNFRNNLLLLYKNLSPGRFRKVFFCRIFLDMLAATRFLFGSNKREFVAVFRAYKDFFALKKKNRSKYKLLIKHSYTSCMYRKSIVYEYYLRGKKIFEKLEPAKFVK